MCLYPKLIKNKKYLPTKKNNYNPPKMVEPRTAYRDWETKAKRMVSKNERGIKNRI